jgi:hypothetical protein
VFLGPAFKAGFVGALASQFIIIVTISDIDFQSMIDGKSHWKEEGSEGVKGEGKSHLLPYRPIFLQSLRQDIPQNSFHIQYISPH